MPFDFEGEANTGDNAQISCYASKGDTPIVLSWTLNGKNITASSGISMISIGIRTNLLSISSIKANHAGVYTCTAQNMAGEARHSATLLVNGILTVENLKMYL